MNGRFAACAVVLLLMLLPLPSVARTHFEACAGPSTVAASSASAAPLPWELPARAANPGLTSPRFSATGGSTGTRSCSGDDCGCYDDEPACIADCPAGPPQVRFACTSACVHEAVQCAKACCAS
jgi:hypothetical protein